MNIEKNQIDELNIQLTLTIAKDDYAAAEKKKLNEQRRNAEFKGFRKGNVPMPLIQRVYGEQVLVDTVNDIISEQLNKFIQDNKLKIVGEPLSSEDQPKIEWKDGNDFTFKFDIATTPEVAFDVDKEDKIDYYEIEATDKAKAQMKENILKQYGTLQEGETAKDDDYVIADLSQEGKNVDGAYISIRNVADSWKPKFIGAKVDDSFEVNVTEAFADEADRASLLKVKKEELPSINPVFKLTVVNVKTFVPAEENQETYDKVFGKDAVKTTEEFDAKVAERLASSYKQEADYRLSHEIQDYFVKKADISLPEAFLKRWLFVANNGKVDKETIDKEFDGFLADFRWQLVRGVIMKKFDLKVEDKDMEAAAEGYVAYQYAMYGMASVPAEQIHESAKHILADENQSRQIEEQVEVEKVIAAVREHITLVTKKISEEKFKDLK